MVAKEAGVDQAVRQWSRRRPERKRNGIGYLTESHQLNGAYFVQPTRDPKQTQTEVAKARQMVAAGAGWMEVAAGAG